ncbi:MAG: hypothetical protein DRP71_07825 [Verrucomicrobia bacterium]|nr:MAG: hypothetical protein DRP71_07825 [Verrucomicrobiota bacterium]
MTKLGKLLLLSVLFSPVSLLAEGISDFDGRWEIIPGKSMALGRAGGFVLDIQTNGNDMTILREKTRRGRDLSTTFDLTLSQTTEKEITTYRLPDITYMGVRMKKGDVQTFSAEYSEETGTLSIIEVTPVMISQGSSSITQVHTLSLNSDSTLTYRITRSSRTGGDDMLYTLKPENSKKAWYMELEDDWSIDSKLDQNALLISLQGVANMDHPNLYFIYPETWDFNFTPHVLEFLENQHNYTFSKLRTADQAVRTFADSINGYIVWDKEVRTSLIVAFTLAGLERAVVVSEEQIPLMEKHGISMIQDFRGKFTGQSDFQIYTWAKAEYWDRCSKECVVWLGGEHGRTMKPGVVDWGMHNKAFFQDLSCRKTDVEEYAMASELLSELEPMSMIYGWHSYKKDGEGEFTTLCSQYGHRISGLHTLPNMSFLSQEPVTPGFEFENQHSIEADQEYKPENKVYIACIQTDCLGLGAWTQPGRGKIPYAWEVTMNWKWMAPAMLEFFYSEATPNDYFIGSLGGPGYMYPRAIPSEKLPTLVEKAASMMKELDLNYFEIMDHAQLGQKEFNSNLTLDIIETYFKYMPDVIGFGNGYGPANTFYSDGDRTMVSFDYYLSPQRSEENAVADLKELIALNKETPYFLLLHVRQWSNIDRVKGILDQLGENVEIVPLDLFTKMANYSPTFKNWYLENRDD